MPNLSIALTTAVIGIAIAMWMFTGPSNLGGPVDYMITSGNSMQPHLNQGDLAVVRVGSGGTTGEIMAYHNDLTRQRVLHRVIGTSGGRFILRGDNNSWVDSFQPGPEEVIGTLWFRVPLAGKAVEWMRSPLHAAFLVGVGTVMSSLWEMRPRKQKWHGTSSSERGSRAPRRLLLAACGSSGQSTLGIMAGVALLAGAAGVVAWQLPSQETVVVQREYEHRGTFGYSAETVIPTPNAAVPVDGEELNSTPAEVDLGALARDPAIRALLDVPVTTGDPILVNVNPLVDFAFDYQFSTLAEGDVSGTVRLDAVVSDITGWKRTFPFAPEDAFTDGQAQIEVDDAELTGLMAAFPLYQAITGHAPVYYTASIIAVVTLNGTVEGQAINDVFEPAVTFRIVPPYEIYVETADTQQFETLGRLNVTTGSSETSGSPFDTSKVGVVEYTSAEPNTVPILGLDLGVSWLRGLTALAGGLALGIMLALFILQKIGGRQGEEFAVEALYGGRIVVLDHDQRGSSSTPATYVAGIADLIRLSQHCGSPVLSQEIDGALSYYVRDGNHLYAYMPARP